MIAHSAFMERRIASRGAQAAPHPAFTEKPKQ